MTVEPATGRCDGPPFEAQLGAARPPCRGGQFSSSSLHVVRAAARGRSERLSGNEERTELADLRKHVRELGRTLGRKTYELEILGNGFRTWE